MTSRKKALVVATVGRHFALFERRNISLLRRMGYEVHCAADFSVEPVALDDTGVVCHQVNFRRTPLSPMNVAAAAQLLSLLKREQFTIVHCHSPVAGFIARLCSALIPGAVVVYSAHGFHFHRGGSAIANIFYRSAERLAAHWTDFLVTINKEDHAEAERMHLRRGGRVFHIPGVGVDVSLIKALDVDRAQKRKELGLRTDAFVVISVGEINKNKNHMQVLKAILMLPLDIRSSVTYVLCGQGEELELLQGYTQRHGLEAQVKFLGFRHDVIEIMKVSDLFVISSFREGLPKAAMEAMAAGLPIVATAVRGNLDLVENGANGLLVEPGDHGGMCCAISRMILDCELRRSMALFNQAKVTEFDSAQVEQLMGSVYEAAQALRASC